jgi:hypothetical protein
MVSMDAGTFASALVLTDTVIFTTQQTTT